MQIIEDKKLEEKIIMNCTLTKSIKKQLDECENKIKDINLENKMNKFLFNNELIENIPFKRGDDQRIVDFINTVFCICEKEDVVLFDEVERDYYRTLEINEYNNMLIKYMYLCKYNILLRGQVYTLIKEGLLEEIDLLPNKLEGNTNDLKNIGVRLGKMKRNITQTTAVKRKEQETLFDKKYILSVNITSCRDLTPIELMATIGHERQHLKSFENGEDVGYSNYVFLSGGYKKSAWWMDKKEAEADKEGYSFVMKYLKENKIKFSSLSLRAQQKLFTLKTDNFKHVLAKINLIKVRALKNEMDSAYQKLNNNNKALLNEKTETPELEKDREK